MADLRPKSRDLGRTSQGPKKPYLILKSTAIPVTGCETSRIPHFLDNQLTDGGEVVSLMHPPRFTPQDSLYSFLLEAESIAEPGRNR
jgi:hypothetical protein